MSLRESKKRGLEKITKEIERCPICKKGKSGKAVPGEGNPAAKIVFVGEAPGREEAKTGRPFVGRSGKLLRAIIKEIGISENEVYITSPVKYLPVYGTPKKSDILHGKTHLLKQLDIIDPKIIVLLGNVACQALLTAQVSVTKDHGNLITDDKRKYFITFHPAAALRFPKIRRAMTKDFQELKNLINIKS
ncbi:MAG: DNA polymerase bacteriophage-type [Microgenomates group bacterium LiPW_16]|nr:MAG: DNA polymerase bacteriophage-type [Microgenomates group bacterium LiPW_16]